MPATRRGLHERASVPPSAHHDCSFVVSMYALMYAMVNTFANVYTSVNQVYMAGLMTAPMVVIELLVMSGTYHRKTWNASIVGVSTSLESRSSC